MISKIVIYLLFQVQAGDSKAGLEAQLTKVVKEKDQLQTEMLCLRTEAATHEDNVSLKKITFLFCFLHLHFVFLFQIALYKDKMKKVHEDMFKYQVENSTLQSQSSSLLSQINQLQVSQAELEGFKRKVSRLSQML